MEEKIKKFFEEATKKHCDLKLYHELLYAGSNMVDYAVKNNRLKDFRYLVTPQKYNDGVMRILYDPFSDDVFGQLNMYLYQEIEGLKGFIDSLYEIDYENLFQIKIKDSRARQISGIGHPIQEERDVIYYSEPACLKSMLKLYDLNIPTWANDTEGCLEDGENNTQENNLKCGINIYYSMLNEENKRIVDKLAEEGFADFSITDDNIVFLKVNCDREETIGEVSDRLLAIVSRLKMQDVKFYQANEEIIRNLVLDIYKYRYTYKKLPYEVLSSQLIKYYEQFTIEEFPEKTEAIQDVKKHRYSEETLNEYFRENKEFATQVLENMVSTIPTEECIEELLENGFYIDEEKKQIFSSKKDYLKHQKYLNSTSNNQSGEKSHTIKTK